MKNQSKIKTDTCLASSALCYVNFQKPRLPLQKKLTYRNLCFMKQFSVNKVFNTNSKLEPKPYIIKSWFSVFSCSN